MGSPLEESNERSDRLRETDRVAAAEALLLHSVSSPITRRVYNMALDEFVTWFQQTPRSDFTKAAVNAWRASLDPVV